jgi:hypothetical protein
MHHLVHETSSHRNRPLYSVAMTIPPVSNPRFEPSRVAVNHELRSYALAHRDHVAFLDMDEYFSVTNVTDSEERARRAALWSYYDDVRLSASGYDKKSSLLFKTIVEFHQRSKTANTIIS